MAALSIKQITQTFRLHGLSITPDAMHHLMDQAPSYQIPATQFLSQLLSMIDKTALKQSLIDKRELQRLLRTFKASATATTVANKKASGALELEDMLGSQYETFMAANGDSVGKVDRATAANGGSAVQTNTRRVMAPRPTVSLVEESFKVIPALAMPPLRYDAKRHRVERLTGENALLLGSAEAKTNMYKTWWYNAHLRERGSVGTGSISTIDSLAGRHAGRWRLMGILLEAEYGLYHLEDPTGRILVDLTNAKAKRPRLFTEGGLVVVEGKMQEDKLIVDLIDVPDVASKEEKPFIPSPLVCDSMSYDETVTRAMSDGGDEGMVVVFSDIRIDNPLSMERLASVLGSFSTVVEEHKPKEKILFVLIGDFFARNKNVRVFPHVIRTPPKPRTLYPFDPLSDVLSRFPELMQCSRFVLVPGPSDPATVTASFALPRDPIPAVMLPPTLHRDHGKNGRRFGEQDEEEDMEEEDSEVEVSEEEIDDEHEGRGKKRRRSQPVTVAEVIRGSNPCRIKYAGQDLLFFRGDMQDKFHRYALNVPLAQDEQVPRFERAVRTIADGGHLSPFPQAAQPIYWDHVQALFLDPALPDLLVLADNAAPFALTHASSVIVNPGSFSTSPFVALYTPSTRICRLLVSS